MISAPGTYGGWDRTGNVTITADGVVLENFILRNGRVDFAGRRNLTIRNFQTYNSQMMGLNADARTCWIERGAFYGPPHTAIGFNFSARWIYFGDCQDDCLAPHGSNGGTIEYCYVNKVNVSQNPEAHADAMHVAGSSNMTIRYNKFVSGTHAGVNSAVFSNFDNVNNTWEYNYFDGGGFAVYMNTGPHTGTVVQHNRWGRSAYFAPITAGGSDTGPITWLDNAFLDNGEVINKP